MRKQLSVLVFFTMLFASNVVAQKNRVNTAEPKPSPTPQITLEQRLGELTKDISDELSDKQKTTVAVAEFVDLNGRSSDFGKFLAEELVTRLFKTKKFKVIERQRLDKVIAEQKLSLTEIIEPSSVKRIGRVLGVEAIVAGTISELGNNYRINARIINTETGELLGAAARTIAKDEEICSLINCGSKPLLPILSTPSSTPKNQPTVSPTPIPQSSQTWKKDSNFYTFELKKCKASGTTVVCDFTVTNTEQDRWLAIHRDSKLFDDFSNKSDSSGITLGGDSNTSWGWAKKFLISGVHVPVRIVFNNVSAGATKVLLLNVHCDTSGNSDSGSNYTDFNLAFRNIPLQ